MDDKQVKLQEGVNNSLISPEFTGTDEEIMAAFNYWTQLVNVVRQLPVQVTGYANREAIVAHFEREVGLLRTGIENVSAKPEVNDQSGVAKMTPPMQGPDPAQQAAIANHTEPANTEKVVDLSAAQESLRRAAGIPRKVDKLARAIENMNPLPQLEEIEVQKREPTPDELAAAKVAARKLAGLPSKGA